MKKISFMMLMMVLLSGCHQEAFPLVILDAITSEYGNALKVGDVVDTTASKKGTRISNVKGFDPYQVGRQKIEITFKNGKQEICKELEITIEDHKKPKIELVKSILQEVGKTIDYPAYLDVYDEVDGKLAYTKENRKVNGYVIHDEKVQYKQAGHYEIDVFAYDKNGNQAHATLPVEIKDKPKGSKPKPKPKPIVKKPAKSNKNKPSKDPSLNALCKEITDEIIEDGMTPRAKAYAVYQWISHHILYRGVSDGSNYHQTAFETLQKRSGNCIGFCFSSKALLDYLQIENTIIHSPSYAHYWNLVKLGSKWYHFDTTPGWGRERFLWSDAQMKAYHYKDLYYVWDERQYPKAN